MTRQSPRLLGLGYSVPPNIRTNFDPIFDWLKDWLKEHHQQNPFQGYETRHVLSAGEDLMTIMLPAALDALQAAKLMPSDIDLLLGCGSVSPYATPNEIGHLHELLGLSASAGAIALNNEFANFNAGLLFADALIRAGRARNVLVAVGCNWSRHVDYHTIQSVSAGDGAAAAVVGPSADPSQWQVIDQNTVAMTSYFGSMYMQGRKYPLEPPRDGRTWLWSDPYFQITIPEGMQGFQEFGGKIAPTAVSELLSRKSIPSSSVTLISHQASSVLLDGWNNLLQPKQTIDTIKNFANMTLASIPVNLAWSEAQNPITEDNLVLFALTPDMQANALLLQRESPKPRRSRRPSSAPRSRRRG